MLPLIKQFEINRLQSCKKMWLELTSPQALSESERLLIEQNLNAMMQHHEQQEDLIGVADFSTRLLSESLLPQVITTAINYILDEKKTSALNLAEKEFTQRAFYEIEKLFSPNTENTITIPFYKLESALQTAIKTVGEPKNIQNYLTLELSRLAIDWTKNNALTINTLVDNVGALGKQVQINRVEFTALKQKIEADLTKIKSKFSNAQDIIEEQRAALKEINSNLNDLAEYFKTEVIKTGDILEEEIKVRIEANAALKKQVQEIKEILKMEKDQEATEAGFNGLRQTGYFISQLGQMSRSDSLIYAGQAISAGAQIGQGIAQLTNVMIPSLAILGPISSVALGGLALVSLFSRKRHRGSEPDPTAAFLQQLSARMEERFNRIEQHLALLFKGLTEEIQTAKREIITTVQRAQMVIIYQVRSMLLTMGHQLSQQLEDGFTNLMNMLRLIDAKVETVLYESLFKEFDQTTTNIEENDSNDEYFSTLGRDPFWQIRYFLIYWGHNKSYHPAITGYYLKEPVASFDKKKRLEYEQNVVGSDPTFMGGYLLNNANYPNPHIWLRAVQAYIKLAMARPDYFSDLASLEKDLNKFQKTGKQILQHASIAYDEIIKEKEAYIALVNEENTKKNLENAITENFNICFNALVGKKLPENNLDKLKWLASRILITEIDTSHSNSPITKTWGDLPSSQKEEIIKKIKTEKDFYDQIPSNSKNRVEIFEKIFFCKTPFSLPNDNEIVTILMLIILLAQAKIINLRIEFKIEYSGNSSFTRTLIKIFNDKEEMFSFTHIPFMSDLYETELIKAFKFYNSFRREDTFYALFIQFFRDQTLITLSNQLNNEEESYELNSALTESDRSTLKNNKETASFLGKHFNFMSKLKVCFPYLPPHFSDKSYKELVTFFLAKIETIEYSIYDAGIDISLEDSADQYASILFEEHYDQKNFPTILIRNILQEMHQKIIASMVTDTIVPLIKSYLLISWDKALTIIQEVNNTMTFINNLPEYVEKRLTKLKDNQDKSFEEKFNLKNKVTLPNIHGWIFKNMEDEENGFYGAILRQMKMHKHPLVSTEEITPSSLKLYVQGVDWKDKDNKITNIVLKLNLILAIVDTRKPEEGFTCYHPNIGENIDSMQLSQNIHIIRIAFNSENYFSVHAHPALKKGYIHEAFTDPKLIVISQVIKRTLWKESNYSKPNLDRPPLNPHIKKYKTL